MISKLTAKKKNFVVLVFVLCYLTSNCNSGFKMKFTAIAVFILGLLPAGGLAAPIAQSDVISKRGSDAIYEEGAVKILDIGKRGSDAIYEEGAVKILDIGKRGSDAIYEEGAVKILDIGAESKAKRGSDAIYEEGAVYVIISILGSLYLD
jgi:hypothetical protein